jgi:hypothetical protein
MDKKYILKEKQSYQFLNLIGTYDEKLKGILFEMFSIRDVIFKNNESFHDFRSHLMSGKISK